MADVRNLINGRDLGVPRNLEELEITIDWQNKVDSGSVSISDLSFVLEANHYLQNRIMDGLNGGVGVFEGEPYTIELFKSLSSKEQSLFKVECYLDFTNSLTSIGGQEITCGLKKKKGEDWLNDVADSFSYASLYDEGILTDADFVKVPYVINFVPDGMQVIMLSMSIYMMSKELVEGIKSLGEIAGYWSDVLMPTIGIGTGFGAVAVYAFDIGKIILAALKSALRIAYVVAIVIAIKKLIEALFEELLPKKRHYLGMSFRRILEKGCEKLGMSFQSSIDELEWVMIPKKFEKGEYRGETGFPTNGGVMYTFGDAIRELKKMFNADYRIVDNVFYFERRDKFEFLSGYRLPSYFNNQERMQQQFKLNTDEIISNYTIIWQYDTQDQNSLDNSGRVFQAITEPTMSINADFVNIKNLTRIDIPFSLGKDKQSLNRVEKLFKTLGKIVDKVTSVITIGNGTNFANKIESRKGSLLLSSHAITYGKVVQMSGGRLARNQRDLLKASNLWDKYHFINSFAEVNGVHNQFFKYENQPVPMNLEEFVGLLENNYTIDEQGNDIYIDKVVYSPVQMKALIDYRVRKKYTDNLTLRIV